MICATLPTEEETVRSTADGAENHEWREQAISGCSELGHYTRVSSRNLKINEDHFIRWINFIWMSDVGSLNYILAGLSQKRKETYYCPKRVLVARSTRGNDDVRDSPGLITPQGNFYR